MDLCGAVGTPLKTARTVVVAETPKSRVETVERLLRVLSFFIRCAGLDKQESPPGDASSGDACSEGGRPTIEKSQSESTLVASEAHPRATSECEVTNHKMSKNRSKNAENLMHRVEGKEMILDVNSHRSVNGIRRTMSYSTKMSRQEEPERGVEATAVTRVDRLSPVETDKSEVIFVLGGTEDLVRLTSKEKRTTQLSEPALSEVESGFSECDSLELSPLSPVRNSKPATTKGQCKCWCGTSRSGAEAPRTCLVDVTNHLPPFKKSESVDSSMMQLEQETKRNNGFLARSLSVNLPVCQRLVKQAPTCNKCGGPENAAKNDLRRTCSKKEVWRRLHRASSLVSFSVKSVSGAAAAGAAAAKPETNSDLSSSRRSRSSDQVCSDGRHEHDAWDAADSGDARDPRTSSDISRIPLAR